VYSVLLRRVCTRKVRFSWTAGPCSAWAGDIHSRRQGGRILEAVDIDIRRGCRSRMLAFGRSLWVVRCKYREGAALSWPAR